MCGIDKEQSQKRMFLDECDMFEYNCDYDKGYLKTEFLHCIQNDSSITPTITTIKMTQNVVMNKSTTKISPNSEDQTKINVTNINSTIFPKNNESKPTITESTTVVSKSSEISQLPVTESNSTCTRTSRLKSTKFVQNSTNAINIKSSTISSQNPHTSSETKTTILSSSTKTEQTQIPSTTNTTIASSEPQNSRNTTKSHSISTEKNDVKNNASASQGICDSFPKHCDRPSTWETTFKGETRDFFQILKARFGNKVKILRDTTHWPHNLSITLHNMRMNLIEDNESFHSGTHNEG
ncbi:unnamed protein product [Euphydryas editha]|uniref:Uncharacterized protein n=1 Tax=Euphydryas editha TaxID=104508 RepID=A0AAU9UB41_EUPED|nr:unnamed protein product [Euphydryas editha]